MRVGPFIIRERPAPRPKKWEHGYDDYTKDHLTEWQVFEGRKIVFRADTFKQAEHWAKKEIGL